MVTIEARGYLLHESPFTKIGGGWIGGILRGWAWTCNQLVVVRSISFGILVALYRLNEEFQAL